MKHGGFLKNAAIISLGGIAAKGIGAFYRIQLVGALGGYGMGLYQMAYPLFCLLLTFSSTGVPSAFSRIVAAESARGLRAGETVKSSLLLFALIGLIGSLAMAAVSPFVSALQGDALLTNCYYALAPSVFFVALIAIFRGYFQGKNQMLPTAVSEIVEQVVKSAAGLYLAYRYRETPALAVAYSLLAVTISELFAFLYLALKYRGERERGKLRVRKTQGAEVLSSALPVMAAASLLPLSQTADSVIIVRLLSRHTARAVSLYGLLGGATTLINLPATVCYGFAAASVPVVSALWSKGKQNEGRIRALYAALFTLLLSLPCAAVLFFFAKNAVAILYPSLPAEDAETLVRLIRLSSVSAATLAGVETLAACLTGMGRAKYAALSMLAGVITKFGLQWALVGNPVFSVGGAAIASNACYLVAFFLDLFYTLRRNETREKRVNDYNRGIGNGSGGFERAGTPRNGGSGRGVASHRAPACGVRTERGGNSI